MMANTETVARKYFAGYYDDVLNEAIDLSDENSYHKNVVAFLHSMNNSLYEWSDVSGPQRNWLLQIFSDMKKREVIPMGVEPGC